MVIILMKEVMALVSVFTDVWSIGTPSSRASWSPSLLHNISQYPHFLNSSPTGALHKWRHYTRGRRSFMNGPIFPLILNSPNVLSLLESTQYPNLIMILNYSNQPLPTQKKPLTGLSQAEDQSCSSREQLRCRCTQLPAFSSIWKRQLNSFQTFCSFFCIICPTWRGCWKTPCQLMRRPQCLLLPPWQKENLKQK